MSIINSRLMTNLPGSELAPHVPYLPNNQINHPFFFWEKCKSTLYILTKLLKIPRVKKIDKMVPRVLF